MIRARYTYLSPLVGITARLLSTPAEAAEVRQAEVRHLGNGLHECVARGAEDRLGHLSVSVLEPVGSAEKGVRLGQGHTNQSQPTAAVRRGDGNGGGWHAMVLGPGPDELGDLVLHLDKYEPYLRTAQRHM